jgi:hypothetical protein
MKREQIKTVLIVLLLVIVLALVVVYYGAVKRLAAQRDELHTAEEANSALQSEVAHYEGKTATEEVKNLLSSDDDTYKVLPPELGGSLHYKIQVLRASPDRYEARITGKNCHIRMNWDSPEARWILYREANTDAQNGTYHTVTCAFNDTSTLHKEILQLLKGA